MVMFCAERSAVVFLSVLCFRLVLFYCFMCSLYMCTCVLHTVRIHSMNNRLTTERRLEVKVRLKVTKSSSYSITERRVPELIPFLGSQPAGDVSHKPDGRLPLLCARPAATPATFKRAAANFAAW